MNILIIEDDALQANQLEEWLLEGGYSVMGTMQTGEDAIAVLKKETPNLLIVDISLKGTIGNGIKMMEIINKSFEIPFIYLTAFPEDYEKAKIKTNPNGFINKNDLSKDLFLREVDLVLHIADQKTKKARRLQNLIFVLDSKTNQYMRITADEICWFETDKGVTHIQTIHSVVSGNKNQYVVSISLGPLMDQANLDCMLRINQKYAVNLNHVTAIQGKNLQVYGIDIKMSVSDKYCKNIEDYFCKINTYSNKKSK